MQAEMDRLRKEIDHLEQEIQQLTSRREKVNTNGFG
jgi:chorismate mutase